MKNRIFTAEFKIQVIEEILANETSIRGAERKYKIDHSVIRQWIKHYKEDGKSYFEENHRIRKINKMVKTWITIQCPIKKRSVI